MSYISIYDEAQFDEDGKFAGFKISMNPSRAAYGHWAFLNEGEDGDDFRAYKKGLNKPEMIIMAANKGEDPNEDIRLRWVPGHKDTYQKTRQGTAEEHLARIREENALANVMQPKRHLPQYYHDPNRVLLSHRTNPQPAKDWPTWMEDLPPVPEPPKRVRRSRKALSNNDHWGYSGWKAKNTKPAKLVVAPTPASEGFRNWQSQSTVDSPSATISAANSFSIPILPSLLGIGNPLNAEDSSESFSTMTDETTQSAVRRTEGPETGLSETPAITSAVSTAPMDLNAGPSVNFNNQLPQPSGDGVSRTATAQATHTPAIEESPDPPSSLAVDSAVTAFAVPRYSKYTPQKTPGCDLTSPMINSLVSPLRSDADYQSAVQNFFSNESRNGVGNSRQQAAYAFPSQRIEDTAQSGDSSQSVSFQLPERIGSSSNKPTERLAMQEQTTEAEKPQEVTFSQQPRNSATPARDNSSGEQLVRIVSREEIQTPSPFLSALMEDIEISEDQDFLFEDLTPLEEPAPTVWYPEWDESDPHHDIMLNVNPEMLSVHELVDRLIEFPDPASAVSPPTPKPESLEDTMADFARIIRNEESYIDDAELHDLASDSTLVMTWAFKQVGGTLIYPNGDISSTALDHLWDEEIVVGTPQEGADVSFAPNNHDDDDCIMQDQ